MHVTIIKTGVPVVTKTAHHTSQHGRSIKNAWGTPNGLVARAKSTLGTPSGNSNNSGPKFSQETRAWGKWAIGVTSTATGLVVANYQARGTDSEKGVQAFSEKFVGMTLGGTTTSIVAHPIRLLTADMSTNPQQTLKSGVSKLMKHPFAKVGVGTRNTSIQFAAYAATPAFVLAAADTLQPSVDNEKPSNTPLIRIIAGFAAGITDTFISVNVDRAVTRSAVEKPKDIFTGKLLGTGPGPIHTQYKNLLLRNLPLGVVTIASERLHDELPKKVQNVIPRWSMVSSSVFLYNMTYGHVTNMAKAASQMTSETSVTVPQSFYRVAELLQGVKEPRPLSTPTSASEACVKVIAAVVQNPKTLAKTAGPRALVTFGMAGGIGAGIRGLDGTISNLIN